MEKNRILHIAGLIQEVERKFSIELPSEITTLHNAFKRANRKLYLVGGAVRDAVLGKAPKDFDVTTDATPEEVIKILNDSEINNFPKGESFGVISAVINGHEFEIATFREESYTGGDGRRPTSVEFSDMKGDAKRRDLTINALYYDIDEQKIIDLSGGLEDIKNGVVKAVGNVMERFNDDRLRVLRLLRFSHRFGSPLDDETKKAIMHFRELSGVSNERVRDEFLKGLKTAISPEKYLEDYDKFGLLSRVFHNSELDTKFIKNLRDPLLVMAKILSPNPADKSIKTLEKLTASNEEKSNVKFLLSIANKFKDFDTLSFVPEVDGKWLMGLSKSREVQNKNLSNEQILQWAVISNLNKEAVKRFLDFKLPHSASDFPELSPGKELGEAISKANGEAFINGL